MTIQEQQISDQIDGGLHQQEQEYLEKNNIVESTCIFPRHECNARNIDDKCIAGINNNLNNCSHYGMKKTHKP